jgi:hypothetical protein
MRINVPKKIKEELELIESVYVEMDDTTHPGADTLKFHVSKLHFEKVEFVNVFDQQWQNCSFVQYRIKYLDGTEEVLRFESKEAAKYLTILQSEGFNRATSRNSANWRECFYGETVTYTALKYLNTSAVGDKETQFQEKWEIVFEAAGILALDNAVISRKGVVYNEELTERYDDITRFGSDAQLATDSFEQKLYEDVQLHKRCPTTDLEYLEGATLNLYTFFSNHNFCHSFLDVGTMLDVLDRSGEKIKGYDHYIIPENSFPLVRKMLCNSGVNFEKLKYSGRNRDKNLPNPGYICENLVTPSVNFFGRFYRPGCFNFLQKVFLHNPVKHLTRKLYISREGNGRDIENSAALEALLLKLGFETVYPSKQIDIPALFAAAKIVIGAHGAAMANCVFCSPGATLIDLIPSCYTHPFFMSMAQAVGIAYIGVICPSKANKTEDPNKKSPYANTSMEVNLAQLRKVLVDLDGI